MQIKALLPCIKSDITAECSTQFCDRRIIELLLDYLIDANPNMKCVVLAVMCFVGGFDMQSKTLLP